MATAQIGSYTPTKDKVTDSTNPTISQLSEGISMTPNGLMGMRNRLEMNIRRNGSIFGSFHLTSTALCGFHTNTNGEVTYWLDLTMA